MTEESSQPAQQPPQTQLSQWDPRLKAPEAPRERGMIVEERLLPQIGTPPDKLAQQEYEEMILSKTDPVDTFIGILAEAWPAWRGGNKLRKIAETMRKLKRSEGGWQQGIFVKSAGASTGQPRLSEVAARPGWVGRNVTDRTWKERAASQGKELPPGETEPR